jgi:FHS family L-fucose permease-like MFS transporter
VLLMAFLIENVEFPPMAVERAAKQTRARDEFRSLLAQPRLRFGLGAMAACMMALVCLWGIAGEYVQRAMPELSKGTLADISLTLWIACAIGRFAGTGLMFRFDPNRLLVLFCGACLVLAALAGALVSVTGFAFLIGASFFISILVPTIFAGAIRDLGPLTKSASGLIVTAAGLGGIAGTIVMRVALLFTAVHFALAVACLCLAAVFAYALIALRPGKTPEETAEGRPAEA